MGTAVLRTLAVRITANSAQFRKDIGKVDAQFKRFSRSMKREAAMFQGQMAAMGATIAGGFGVAEVARAADEMVNLRNKMGATYETSRDVAIGMQNIKYIAKTSRTSLDAVGTLYQRIAVSTKSLGTSQSDVAKVTKVVADSFLMSGTTASEAANSARQFAQGLASGTLRGDEFRSVSENNVVLTQMLAEGLNMTVGQLRLFAQEGGLTAETILPILTAKVTETDDAVRKMSLTIGQARVLFRNAFVEMVDRLNQTYNVVPKVAKAIGVMADNVHLVVLGLGTIATLLISRVVVGLVAFTAVTLAGAVKAMMALTWSITLFLSKAAFAFLSVLTSITMAIQTLVVVLVKGLYMALRKVFLLIIANPITALVVALAAVGAAVGVVIAKFFTMERIGLIIDGLALQFEGMKDKFANIGSQVEYLFGKMTDNLKSKFAEFLEAVGQDEWAAEIRAGIEDVRNAPIMRDGSSKIAQGRAMVGSAFSSETGPTVGEAMRQAKESALSVLSSAGGAVMSGTGIDQLSVPNFEEMKAKFGEFVGSVGSTALEAIPGFQTFWNALTGKTDPDAAAAAEPAEGEGDRAYSWAERWKMALAEVKDAWTGLATTVKGKVQSMSQQYATWDSVLSAGAKKSKKLAAVQKMIMLKEAIMNGKLAIMKAWSSAPFPANLPGVALTTLQTGLVIRDIMKGQAHDGHDSLPSTGTYMLEKGERVVSARVNKDLTDYLATSQSQPQQQPINFTISGVSDPDLVFNALQSRQGELTEMIRGLAAENISASPF